MDSMPPGASPSDPQEYLRPYDDSQFAYCSKEPGMLTPTVLESSSESGSDDDDIPEMIHPVPSDSESSPDCEMQLVPAVFSKPVFEADSLRDGFVSESSLNPGIVSEFPDTLLDEPDTMPGFIDSCGFSPPRYESPIQIEDSLPRSYMVVDSLDLCDADEDEGVDPSDRSVFALLRELG